VPTDALLIDPQVVKINKRSPIPFRPFELLDPKTGKPISPDALLTLPKGQTIPGSISSRTK
jgi:hypothetical protein